MKWDEGDRVVHPVWGLGTVRSCGEGGPVVVEFDRGGAPMIGERVAWLRRAEAKDLGPAPEPTFVLEPEDAKHSTVDRLMAVGAGPEWLGQQMREAFGSGHMRVVPEEASTGQAAEALGSLPKGYCVAFPRADAEIVGTVRVGDQRELVGIAPFCDTGVRIPVELRDVEIASNGVEARLQVAVGPAALGFYDTRFCVRRHTYVGQPHQELVLAGFAYECGPATADVVDVPAASRVTGAPERLHLRGFAALLPAQGGDIDEYEFRGPVALVETVDFATGPVYRLVVTVIRELDGWGDLDVPILVAPGSWKGAEPPQPGQDVEGILWLQGFMAGPDDGT